MSELIGGAVGLILTLLIFSYLLGDNALFRFAIHVFIGVAAAFVAAVAFNSVLVSRLLRPLLFGLPLERLMALIPLALAVLLLLKIFPRLSALGSPVMAFLAGVGAAVAVGGAVVGTLFPQALATAGGLAAGDLFGMLNGAILLVGVTASLAYFHFHVRTPPPAWAQVIRGVGGIFIAAALGAVFAGVYSTALTAMIERLTAMVQFIGSLIGF
jgi:hypothetical protein